MSRIHYILGLGLLVFFSTDAIASSGDATCTVQRLSFFQYYAQHLRGNLFGGFLTLGGFLLALQTFVVVKMKEDLYDSEAYKGYLRKIRVINPKIEHYGSLRRFSMFLSIAVTMCLLTSVMQLTIGLIPNFWTALVCLASSAVALLFLIFVLFVVSNNLKCWFKHLEDTSPIK